MTYQKPFDFLSVVHVCSFYLIGLVFKNAYLFAFLLGIGWELLEYTITSTPYTRRLLVKYWPVPKSIWDEKLINTNRLTDLVFNMIGYGLAQL